MLFVVFKSSYIKIGYLFAIVILPLTAHADLPLTVADIFAEYRPLVA